MTEEELIVVVTRKINDLSTYLDADDYSDAVDEAERELGFSLPTSVTFQVQWLQRRTIRHLVFALAVGAAKKFKAEGFDVGQRFKNYMSIVKMMDEDFEKCKEEEWQSFDGIDAYKTFGFQASMGFAYEKDTGRDITYSDSNKVTITPETD